MSAVAAAPLGRRVMAGAAFMMAGRLAIRCLSIVSTLVLARLLMPEDFGLVALALAAFAIADAVTNTGYATLLIRTPDITRGHYDTAWTLNLLRCLLLALAVAGTASWQAALLGDARIGPVLLAVAAGVALDGLVSIGLVRLQREFRFDRFATYQVATRLLNFGATLALAVLWQSYWAIILGTLAAKLLALPLGYALAPHRPRPSLWNWRYFLGFSGWGTVFNMAMVMEMQGASLIIGRLLGLPALGQYNLAQQVATVPVSEIAAPTRAPLLAGYAELARDRAALARSYLDSQALLFAVICPISVGIALVSPELERVALGPRWEGTWPMIAAIALVALADNFSNAVFSIFAIFERYRDTALAFCLVAALRTALLLGGAWWWGMEGLLGALALSALAGLAFWQWLVARALGHGLGALPARTWRTLAAAAAMAAGVLALRAAWPEGAGLLPALGRLLAFAALGAALHLGTQFLLWRLCGAPPGAERRLANLALGALERLRRRRKA
ncbi:oligosaccharide flippase family protein [Roseococcus sp. DSY-14]|uniref:oligosaccharide flippase family protein n=1 Tax=Roseococcus sp. DSY-14 TaxID=3369650 RepID=UPI00387AD035